MSGYFRDAGEVAAFGTDKATKADLFAGAHLFVGLNCFEPGRPSGSTPIEARTSSTWSSAAGR